MGLQESKEQLPEENVSEEPNLNESSAPTTPILTPLDPRSPSENIARTPLETILGYVKEEESPIVLSDDPRSPTLAFERTPIVVSAIPKRKNKRNGAIINKNLEIVQKCEPITPRVIAPKLLDSSPISTIQKATDIKRKSFVGLLETNIDYTETDLDAYAAQKRLSYIPTADPIEENTESTPESTDTVALEDAFETVKIEITNQLEDEKPAVKEKSINITAHVKDFDKKLTNLIYQDDSGDELNQQPQTPQAPKLKDNNRTPLGTRNGNEMNKKSTGKLKVKDRPRKSELSKIPVLKEKKPKKLDGIQCENTPPRIGNGKVTAWDTERTLII